MTSGTAAVKLRDGDIYRWRHVESGDDRPFGRYHCCSRIAVVHKGRLRDTYWQIGDYFGEGKSFGIDDLGRIELTFIANCADLEKRHESDVEYYDCADVVDLNHPNSSKGNFYIRKGAKRSAAKMLESANRRLEAAKSDEQRAKNTIERLTSNIQRINSGDIEGYLG